MRTYSASEAISPAFSRTWQVLFKPFRMGRTWKFSATAYVSLIGTFFLPFPLVMLPFFMLTLIPDNGNSGNGWVVWAAVAGGILATALLVWIFALCSRLQFAFFDVVLNRSQYIAPLWRHYGPQAARWTKFKILFGTALSVGIVGPIGFVLYHVFSKTIKGATVDPEKFPAYFFVVIFLIYGIFGLFMLAMSLINDFVLPSLALEDTTIAEAFRRFGELARREPGQMTLYAVVKALAAIILPMVFGIAMEVAFLIVIMGLVCLGLLIGWMLHATGIPMWLLQGFGIALIIPFYLAFIFYLMPIAYGIGMTFLEAYRLYFLAGRYPMLGDLLQRSTPLPPLPPYYDGPMPPALDVLPPTPPMPIEGEP